MAVGGGGGIQVDHANLRWYPPHLSPVAFSKSRRAQESFETVCYQARTYVVIQVQVMAARQLRHLDGQALDQLSNTRLREQHALLRHHQFGRTLQTTCKR